MIVVANKYRLMRDGDKFVKDHKKFLRSVKIKDTDMDEYNKTTNQTGILYEVDQKATDERNQRVNPEPKKKGRPVKTEKTE